MEGHVPTGYGTGHLGGLVVEVAAWVVVGLACLVVVRRPWAWPGLLGGVLGATAAVAVLVDELMVRSALGPDKLGAHVFDTGQEIDWPGFVLDHGLEGELAWTRALALALLAAAVAVGAVQSRRARRAD